MTCGRILLVDNDDDNRELTCQVLRRENYRVEEVTSGELALDDIKSARPDLVITSTFTSDISGLNLVRRIRSVVDASGLPIVMYTPITSEAKLEALEAGVNDFLTRPFHQTELVARTRALVAFRQAHRDLADLKQTLTENAAGRSDSLHLQTALLDETQRARQEWNAIFNAISDAVVITDSEGRITRVNNAAGRLFNQPAEQFSGIRCANLFERNSVCPHYLLSELVTSAEMECQSHRADLRLMIRTQRIADASRSSVSFAHFLRATSEVTREATSSASRSAYVAAAGLSRDNGD